MTRIGKHPDSLVYMGMVSLCRQENLSARNNLKLLANEKRTGDVLLGKTYVVDGI